MSELQKYLDFYKEEFGIDTKGKDIDEILGISDLNLKPYVWEPYIEKAERYLQLQLKLYLLELQKAETEGFITSEFIFQEFQNLYILLTPVKEITKRYNIDGQLKDYTHLLLTIYDTKTGVISHLKKPIIRVKQHNGAFYYNKIKINTSKFNEVLKDKFNTMGLFSHRKKYIEQHIYISRLLPAIKFINNDLIMKPNFEGHHVFFDTQSERISEYSMLLINKKQHSKEFHPNNTRGTNGNTVNKAKGILYNNMLKLKYFLVKEKKFNADIRFNIPDILMYYFVEHKSISEVQRAIKSNNPKRALSYNTITKIISHFTQYTPVLTPQNIDYIRDIEK